MSAKTVLVVDDDATLRELLSDYLTVAGYRTFTASDGRKGLRIADDSHPDLVILDLMMPGMNGWEVCQLLRARSNVPIIMLTAKGEEISKLRGFRMGIDDYVTKPFSFAELVARIGAVLSRVTHASLPSHAVTSGDLTIDFEQKRLTVAGRLIDLTPTEYRLLEVLARHLQHTLSTEQLLIDVWGAEYAGAVDQVKHFIWTLRKKIESDPGDPKHLITERGFGYRFE